MRDDRVPPRRDRDRRRRELSQNFLRTTATADWFVDLADLHPRGLVLEVGGGEGVISRAAAPRCRELDVFEIDPVFLPRLERSLAAYDNVTVVGRDFLSVRPPDEPFQVIGNVPFSITAPVVDWCLDALALDNATFITQLEYARKRTGDFGRWSLLTVRTWPLFSWELCGRIPRTEFRPVPKVDAGVLQLTQRRDPLVPHGRLRAYDSMVELGFTGVGGSLYASLARRFPAARVARAFAAAGVERDRVVAFVHPSEWLDIFASLDARR
ncbi:ErmE/ErmH/ErmO/ErmR family 23S rRNA (adenine(2058)-N(6))-methyltransferase [Micromonospora sp. WMMD987]|uniref:ErmE/ErmH/ErmO/ErmR family 23S rRNA (adenine(2058)-N(6))-methyltransferase n=1 Tax=Micromonospora TaxID=1873 RepID=UPI00249BA5B4|nr:ErmE/ErmH/ErmO/ErmR family 23S rRNA (adenine(2058)-N(6))-methyltransferase [Micromonospora sp. WMMD987]WFE96517.1 ErmE/ErmH/ErmO/ErmR family 23S rRNA (adenine(2058)-N(6))-methyltransferase [Micromonospora sp. WMMD987]